MSFAYLFPGQGSQYTGMGAAWYRASTEARAFYDQADTILGYPLSRLCFEGPLEQLNLTEFTQPAVFVTALGIWQACRASLDEPACVAGHSLGEYAALVAAGALTFEQALPLVAERGRLMAQAGVESPGGMAVLLGADLAQAQALCAAASQAAGAPLVIANDNCPGQIVVSGALSAVDSAVALARDHGIRRAQRLAVSVATHSPLMLSAQSQFAARLATLELQLPSIPVVMNTVAAPLPSVEAIREALVKQLTSPVRWRESLMWMAGNGVQRFVETGPKNVLTGLVGRTLPGAQTECLEDRMPAGAQE